MIYFAYGSNMDKDAMRALCPRSQPLGLACLMKHKIFVMAEGYASVRTDPQACVHGVLYDLAMSDVAALDRYEEVARGLYRKITQPVLRAGAAPVRAMIYVGQTKGEGTPKPDYWQGILAAAEGWALPPAYLSSLRVLGGAGHVVPSAAEPAPSRRAIKLKGI